MSIAEKLKEALRKEEEEKKLEARTSRKEEEIGRRWGSPSIGERIGESLSKGVGSMMKAAQNYLENPFKKKKPYMILLLLFLFYILLRENYITGYSVLETVTQTNIISPFLIFLIIICIVTYYKLNYK